MTTRSTVFTDPRMEDFVLKMGPAIGFQSRAMWFAFQAEFGEPAAPSLAAFQQFCRRIQGGGHVIPGARQRLLTTEVMQISCERLLVTSDHHIPAHDADWLEFALRLGEAWGCEGHALNGDFGNLKSVANFDSQLFGGEELLEETLAIIDEVIFQSCRLFGSTWLDLGNHEHWLTRRLLQSKLAPERLKVFLTGDHPNVELTEFSYMVANEDRAHGRPGVRITHPRNFSRLPATVGRQLASKFLQHVVVGHDHLVGYTRDVSGQFTVVHSGCMADPDRLDYVVTVDSTAPAMAQGFVIVDGNRIYLFDKANTDQERWLWMARRGRQRSLASKPA